MFERCLYFNINSLTRNINRVWDDAFAIFDLSPSHAYILRLVLASPGITPKLIKHELKLEKSTVTRFIDVLKKKGFLIRKKGLRSDAREQGIYPTKKAEKIATQLEEKGEELYQKMIASLGENKLNSLVKQLRTTQTQIK